MCGNRLLHVEINVQLDREPISGTLRSRGADEREFTGVLELIELLDEACDDWRRASAGSDGRPGTV